MQARTRRSGAMVAAVASHAALVLALGGCAALSPGPRGEPTPGQAACWPQLPYRGGWLGGDVGASVVLSATRSVWLFGDSFVGAAGQANRSGAHFVHNTVAVSDCGADGKLAVRYAWGEGADGTPRAFFAREGGGWWWPLAGFAHRGVLYVGLLEVEPAPPSGPLGMAFRLTGTRLARVANPEDDPELWRVETLRLSSSAEALPLSALVVDGAHLYLFTFLERTGGRHPRVLARLPLARLAGEARALESALETWGREGAWLPGLRPDAARVLMEDDASEMSVRYHAALGRWVALYAYPEIDGPVPEARPSDAVWLRTAPELTGPWSERRRVFRIPELAAEGADPHTGCYAAREHPQFARPGSLTFTYVCNLFAGSEPGQGLATLERLMGRMGLYRPVPAAVSLPVP